MGKALSLVAVVALALATSACSERRSEHATAQALDDARIITALVAMHQGEVDAARIAVTRSTDVNVQGFAVRMQTEHNAAIDRLQAIARDRALVPAGSDLSQNVARDAARTGDALNAASAARFDALYMGTQYDRHLKVIALMDTVIIPNIADDELRREARDEREQTVSHLDHVETARAQLAATTAFERQRASR